MACAHRSIHGKFLRGTHSQHQVWYLYLCLIYVKYREVCLRILFSVSYTISLLSLSFFCFIFYTRYAVLSRSFAQVEQKVYIWRLLQQEVLLVFMHEMPVHVPLQKRQSLILSHCNGKFKNVRMICIKESGVHPKWDEKFVGKLLVS